MIQRACVADPVCEQFVASVLAVVDPWRIVLFGSRARGDATVHSDYDLFVELDIEKSALKGAYQCIRHALQPARYPIDVKVACRGSIEERGDDPGTMEWDVAREGVLLYAHPLVPVALPSPRREVREPKTPESVYEWLESGDRDR
jgi:predicted nucleotidyltransferase